MAFFKFRQRGQTPPEPANRAISQQESIDNLRRRARHRLLGAAVLVLAVVIGFPLLFDTQPRPVSVNAPITIPDKDSVPPLPAAGATNDRVPDAASLGDREQVVNLPQNPRPTSSASANPATNTAVTAAVAPASASRSSSASPSPSDATPRNTSRTPTPVASAPTDNGAAARAAEDAARARREADAKAKRDEAAKAEADAKAKRETETKARREAEAKAKRDEAARARAILEGNSKPSTSGSTAGSNTSTSQGRFALQVGAFADDSAVRDVQQRAEKAGVKTYTQVVNTSAGKRTRVRVGPFSSRAEAEKAAATLKKAGLAGSILPL
jgi:DedD protein